MEHNIENTPQDIGPTECANQTVVTMTKHILEAQKLEKSLWAQVVANPIYTLNQCPTRVLCFITPKEM